MCKVLIGEVINGNVLRSFLVIVVNQCLANEISLACELQDVAFFVHSEIKGLIKSSNHVFDEPEGVERITISRKQRGIE